jgi:hypothetical protein
LLAPVGGPGGDFGAAGGRNLLASSQPQGRAGGVLEKIWWLKTSSALP